MWYDMRSCPSQDLRARVIEGDTARAKEAKADDGGGNDAVSA